jgi:sugar-specific transcriptional regulator TrmB
MSDQTDIITAQLQRFGITHDEAKIYLLLQSNDSQTALAISRRLKIGRTKVYRILDRLIAKGLVRQKLENRGLQFGATEPKQLELLIAEKEAETKTLRSMLPELINQLKPHIDSKGSQVVYYHGVEGLKQVTWNSLKAKDILRIYEIKNMDAFLDRKLSEEIRREFVKRKIYIRELTNLKKLEDWTDTTELVTRFWRGRYISPKEIKINFETMIYNEVYCMYTYEKKEIFCVEIYNADLAEMQKQLFDFIWDKGTPMHVVDPRGRVEV